MPDECEPRVAEQRSNASEADEGGRDPEPGQLAPDEQDGKPSRTTVASNAIVASTSILGCCVRTRTTSTRVGDDGDDGARVEDVESLCALEQAADEAERRLRAEIQGGEHDRDLGGAFELVG